MGRGSSKHSGASPSAFSSGSAPVRRGKGDDPVQVDARHKFENFVTGSANRLAVAAARAVAEQPGLTYNPLFIYSGSGLGKTHLMGAIGNLAAQRDANLKVEYISLEDFVEQLHAAIAANEADRFKQRYGRV